MNRVSTTLILALLGNANGCTHSLPTRAVPRLTATVKVVEFAPATPLPAPPPAPANGPIAIHSNTTEIEDLAGRDNELWVATRGGLEQYDVTARKRIASYTTQDGLPTLFIESVSQNAKGLPEVTTAKQHCVLHGASRRFACVPRHSTNKPALTTVTERIEGASVTARWSSSNGDEWLGTAGLGLWVRRASKLERVTPGGQITSNHVVAIVEWNGTSYFATFDRGLSRLKDGNFTAISIGPRMLNDVIATPTALFVATSNGLYGSTDGAVFHRESRVTESTISDLAYDTKRRILYATATNSLWELPLDKTARKPRSVYLPAGSHSLQAVDVSEDGIVYLASEDRGVLRRDSKGHFTGFDRLAGYPSSWATDVLAYSKDAALFASLRHGVFLIGAGRDLIEGAFDPWTLFLGRDWQHSDAVFVGTQGGAWIVQGKTTQSLAGLPNPCVHSVARLSSGLWVGTEGGLAQYR